MEIGVLYKTFSGHDKASIIATDDTVVIKKGFESKLNDIIMEALSAKGEKPLSIVEFILNPTRTYMLNKYKYFN